jgi:hypothetical protein
VIPENAKVPPPFNGKAVLISDLPQEERERVLDDLFKGAIPDQVPGQLSMMAMDYEGEWSYNCE